ncbi:hypothetical protein Pint_23849 [Pistacia integerrima]|uniref:Uncharacterized protein n=1 Tax=Pistacia integerrima TaxID=434235 RepID=A0ACC0YK50_9ROSI|nr:hypothetical protein Pint_23849 [Pistacia integerrima]
MPICLLPAISMHTSQIHSITIPNLRNSVTLTRTVTNVGASQIATIQQLLNLHSALRYLPNGCLGNYIMEYVSDEVVMLCWKCIVLELKLEDSFWRK